MSKNGGIPVSAAHLTESVASGDIATIGKRPDQGSKEMDFMFCGATVYDGVVSDAFEGLLYGYFQLNFGLTVQGAVFTEGTPRMRTRYPAGRPRRASDLIRPKLVSDGAPTPVPEQVVGLIQWYDPSELGTLFKEDDGTDPVTANNDPVGFIEDKSTKANHAIQGTPAARPTFKSAGIGGIGSLEFDGTDDNLIFPNASIVDLSSGFTFFIITNRLGGGPLSFAGLYAQTSATTTGGFILTDNSTATPSNANFNAGGTLAVDTNGLLAVDQVIRCKWDGSATMTIQIDDRTAQTNSLASLANALTPDGGLGISIQNGRVSNLQHGEVLLYDNSISGADETTIYSYLATKWGVTVP